jgi:hypothetical protein
MQTKYLYFLSSKINSSFKILKIIFYFPSSASARFPSVRIAFVTRINNVFAASVAVQIVFPVFMFGARFAGYLFVMSAGAYSLVASVMYLVGNVFAVGTFTFRVRSSFVAFTNKNYFVNRVAVGAAVGFCEVFYECVTNPDCRTEKSERYYYPPNIGCGYEGICMYLTANRTYPVHCFHPRLCLFYLYSQLP